MWNARFTLRNSLAALAVLATCLFAAFPAAAQTPPANSRPFITPQLNFDIPGLAFTPILVKNGSLQINYIGDYLTAVYRVLLGVSVTIAIVMVMVGGFQYVISPATGDVKAAKERIKNAVVGLVLLLSVYVILFTINPQLTLFNALNISEVQAVPLIFDSLQTTTANTGLDESGASPGSHTSAFSSCPIAGLSSPTHPANAADDPSNKKFYAEIQSHITATTAADRVIQIADAAAACDVDLGSCGRTIGTIAALAGIGDASCLTDTTKPDGCRDYERLPQKHQLDISTIKHLGAYRCGTTCTTGGFDSAAENCSNSSQEATARVASDLVTELGATGYPDSWTKDLQPGDMIWIYNGNNSCPGLHSQIFVGWAAGGNAQVIDGSAGRSTQAHTVCITSQCGSSMRPLVRIFGAQ